MITLTNLEVKLWDGRGHMIFLIPFSQLTTIEDVVMKYDRLPLPGFGMFEYGASAHMDHYQFTVPEYDEIIPGDKVDVDIEFELNQWRSRIDMSVVSVRKCA